MTEQQNWRKEYVQCIEEFKKNKNESLLIVALQRLGFIGYNLDSELEFIKENY